MENSTVTITLDAATAEATMDRLLEKAAKLKSILTECENFVEALDDADGIATKGELLKTGPHIVYAINLGTISQVALAPADGFAPEFMEQLAEDLPKILAKRPAPAKMEMSKQPKIIKDNIIVGNA